MTASTLMNKSKKELAELVLSKEKTIATLKDDLQATDITFEKYKESKEADIVNANNKFNKLSKEFDLKVKELVDLKLKYKKSLEIIDNQENTIKDCTNDIKRKNTELNDLQNISRTYKKETTELNAQLESARDEIDDLTTDLFVSKKSNKTLLFTNIFTGLILVILLIYMLFY